MNYDGNYAHVDVLRKKKIADNGVRNRSIMNPILGCSLIGATLFSYFHTPPNYVPATAEYVMANIISKAFEGTRMNPKMTISWNNQKYRNGAKQWARNSFLREVSSEVAKDIGTGAGFGFAISAILLIVSSGHRRRKEQELLADKIISGTKIVSEKELAALTNEDIGPYQLDIGNVKMPTNLEARHTAILGTTGSGKTTVLRQLLDRIEARGQAALIYDTSGEFIANYYNPRRGDIILNPFDERGAFWNPFAEISHPADTDRIARYLINETGDRDRDIWLEAARNLVANIMRKMWESDKCTPLELLNTLQFMKRDELEAWLANTSSARIFAEDADKATGSVLFMLSKACNLLMFLRANPRENEKPFSFSEYFNRIDKINGWKPWIFVPRKEDYFEAVKPLMALWLECASSACLGLAPSNDRNVWFFLDELADLPRVDNLARLLPEGRKFGASVVLTFQAVGQMRNRYGNERAEAMLGCCNTKLFMQLIDQESRQWASETIGKSEVEISTLSEAIDPKTGKFNKTLSASRQIRAAVLEADLRLPKYTAYLLFPDGLPVAQIKLTDAHILGRGAAKQDRFIPIDIGLTLWGQVKKEDPIEIISLSEGPV